MSSGTDRCAPAAELCPAVRSRVSPTPAVVSYTRPQMWTLWPHLQDADTHPPFNLLHWSPSPASERVLVPQRKEKPRTTDGEGDPGGQELT